MSKEAVTRRAMLGRSAGALAGVAAFCAGGNTHVAFAAEEAAAPRKPNIIFILADDLGYGDLGCYGQKMIATPNLDQFAAEGVRFTDFYAGSTVCAPSRCVLMTGLHTGHCRVRGNARVPLEPQDVTIAEVLKQAGYTTGLVGKWGLGEPDTTGVPNRQGFDYFFGYLNQGRAHNYYPEYVWRNEERVRLEGNVEDPEHPQVSLERQQYSHDLFAEEALQFIERSKDAPFFLYLAFTLPHANNERGRFDGDGMEVPDYGPYADEPWPKPQRGHAAMIHRLDRDVGRVTAKLKELGLDENTLVVFSSDNGTHKEGGADPEFFDSSGPLRGYKRDLYEGGIRVPTMARWPGKIEAGRTSDHVGAFWDMMPTFAEVSGGTAPMGIDGVSIVPALLGAEAAGREQPKHEYLYWEFHEGGSKQAARMGDWKGIRFSDDAPIELYNLANDLGETSNIAAEHPDIVAQLTAKINEAHTESEHWPLRFKNKQ